MTAGELHDALAQEGPGLVESILEQFQAGVLRPVPQDESLVTIATKLSRADDHVDFLEKADFIRRQIHALTPWPGATLAIIKDAAAVSGEVSPPAQPIHLKVLRVQPEPGNHQEDPGALLDIPQGIVACGKHTRLRLLEVQPPGKTPMKWAEFARGVGRRIEPGSRMVPAKELV
jgi:methionyl-tRNA formyltransferase